jgi:hypothetical protein
MHLDSNTWGRRAALAALAVIAPAFAADPLVLPPGAGDWTPFRPGTVEYQGRTYTPSCSQLPGVPSPVPGGGTADTTTFQFWAKRGTVNNLVVFFEGGGACWDARTCLGVTPTGRTAPTFVPYGVYQDPRNIGTGPGQFSGVFDLTDPRNPFKDWNFVYIPYCTGDIHAGSAVQSVPLPTPAGPVPIAIHHRGHDNFVAVLKFMTENFDEPGPRQIFVTGASAGGYGAMLNMPWIEDAFRGAQLNVLADASQGITTTAWDAVRDAAWNFQIAPWISHGESIPMSPARIFQRTFEYYPNVSFGQYTTDWDTTQILFYDLMADPLNPTPGICADWHDRMRADLLLYQGARNFRSYAAFGNDHTVTRSPKFYSEASASGVRLVDWVTTLLKPQAGTPSPGGRTWTNAACTGSCGAIPPAACPF